MYEIGAPVFETRESRKKLIGWSKGISIAIGLSIAPILTFGFHAFDNETLIFIGVIALLCWVLSGLAAAFYLIMGVIMLFGEIIPNWEARGALTKPKSRKQLRNERKLAAEEAKRAFEAARLMRDAEVARLANINLKNNEPRQITPDLDTHPGQYDLYSPGEVMEPQTEVPIDLGRKRLTPFFDPNKSVMSTFTPTPHAGRK